MEKKIHNLEWEAEALAERAATRRTKSKNKMAVHGAGVRTLKRLIAARGNTTPKPKRSRSH